MLDVLLHHAKQAEKFLGAGKAVYHAADVARHGHDNFLPWAKRYREHLRAGTGIDDPELRRVRAGLGGSSRWLYARQKQTFVDLVGLIVPFGSHVPPTILDSLWSHFQALEVRMLARSRRV